MILPQVFALLAGWFRFRDAHHSEVLAAMKAITPQPTRTQPSWTVRKVDRFSVWQDRADRILRKQRSA